MHGLRHSPAGEGKSPRDIRRCIERGLARQLFKLLEGYHRSPVEAAYA